jgi:hypothetical protein
MLCQNMLGLPLPSFADLWAEAPKVLLH